MEIYIGIDVGGTFTDIAATIPSENRIVQHKLPSTPGEPDKAIIDGIAALLRENGLHAGDVKRLAHGTTVGTNALIQRRCGKVGLITTDGFRDLLEIGRQTRPRVYDMHADHPAPLVPRKHRLEVVERRLANGEVHRPLDLNAVAQAGMWLARENVDCIVVCFLHSYAFPEHEQRAIQVLRETLPNEIHVLASADVYPEFREYERLSTAVLNAALLTVMNTYLDRFTKNVREIGITTAPKVSQSAGGLMSIDMARAYPIRTALSGPAAGVLGALARAGNTKHKSIITLDVGGTSADVSLIRDGEPTLIHERTLAGFPLRLPVLDVNAVGAGGGSIAWIDRDGLLKVGPNSAGARPGPACYGFGGQDATVTDANVVLGRLNQTALLDGRMPITFELARNAVCSLSERLNLSIEETALGIVRVASATIVKAIRAISVERGHDPKAFSLFAFGGAGPLHAADVARDLGIAHIIVPPSPGILCAEGLLASELMTDFVRTILTPLSDDAIGTINDTRDELQKLAGVWFHEESVPKKRQRISLLAQLRYKGQNYELSVPVSDAPIDKIGIKRLVEDFHAAHEMAYGFSTESEPIEFVNMKLLARGELEKSPLPQLENSDAAQPLGVRRVVFSKSVQLEAPIYRRGELARSQKIIGPAIIEQLDTTVIIFPDDICTVDNYGNLLIDIK